MRLFIFLTLFSLTHSPTFLLFFVSQCYPFFRPRASLYSPHSLEFHCICRHPPLPSLPQPPTPQRSWWACETHCGRRFNIIEFATPERRVREVNCLLQLYIMHDRVAASAQKDRIFPLPCLPEDTKNGEGEGGLWGIGGFSTLLISGGNFDWL